MERTRRRRARCARLNATWCLAGGAWLAVATARADDFDAYSVVRTVQLPGAGPVAALPDGRLVALDLDTLAVERGAGSGRFDVLGALPDADIALPEAAFLCVSPDGLRVAVGNNGGASFTNFQVGVFALGDLSGAWFDADHSSAAWIDDQLLALSAAGGIVTVLDTTSPDPRAPLNIVVISGIGGASAGVGVDATGRLYTGNGFALGGPSSTGTVKAFDAAAWQAALRGGPAVDFESSGVEIVTALSALSLQFDHAGNLWIGGGDFIADPPVPPAADAVAAVRAQVVAAALAGRGPANVADPSQVRFFDPAAGINFFAAASNPPLMEIAVRDFADSTVYMLGVRAVPATGPGPVLGLAALMLCAGCAVARGRLRS